MATPDNIQPETYKSFLEPTTSTCCRGMHLARHVPIANLSDGMDRRVRHIPHPPANQQELIETLQREWLCIPPNLIRRMSRRVFACIKARDGNTRC